jgi:nitroimidazol reductase NimA-like FMN-containing flavoprotein (pyridoxamine 5'-phosphate oxidase superfamily)
MSDHGAEGLDVIPYHQCLELLDTEEVGRLSVVLDGRPEVFPVNYVLAGDRILFRTEEGTKLDGATRAPVAFEVDHFERETRSGWSVVVHGRAALHTVFDSHAEQRATRLWVDADKPHLVLITPDTVDGITGRRIPCHPQPA